MIYRIGVILLAVAAGAATGAVVFKIIGEERVGSEIKLVASRLGFVAKAGDGDSLALLEKIAPGTKAGFQSAIVGTVVASLIAATATTIVVREIAG